MAGEDVANYVADARGRLEELRQQIQRGADTRVLSVVEQLTDSLDELQARIADLEVARAQQDLVEAARQRLAELTVLHEATREVAGLLESDVVLACIVRHAARLRLDTEVHAAILDVVDGAARVVAHHHPEASTSHVDTVIDIAQGSAARRVLERQQPWTWRTEQLSPSARCLAKRLGLRHGATVAIPRSDHSIHLVVATSDPQPFSAQETELLESLAGIAAIALGNADSYHHLAVLAATDPLTGLPNRRHLEHLLHMPQERGLAVLAIDVDNLKHINDIHGHDAGDDALRTVAQALKACLREGDTVARTGGDEFIAVLFGAGESDARGVAERMRDTLRSVRHGSADARISVGMAVTGANSDVTAAWHAADQALYAAKARGRDQIAAGGGTAHPPGQRLHWVDTLDAVLRSPGVYAVYQPVVRLRDRSVVGYQALMRPQGASVSMSVLGLFETARTLGLVRDLDWVARRAAFDGAVDLPARALLFVKVALTALLDPPHGADQMLLLAASAGRAPADVVIEVTGRESLRDVTRYQAVLADHRAQGFRIAIADLGDGQLSLSSLTGAQPDYLKLARGFIRHAGEPALRAVLAFAHAMDATVVAEGLATDAQVALMTELGVEFGQGYALGRPSRSFEPALVVPGRSVDTRTHKRSSR